MEGEEGLLRLRGQLCPQLPRLTLPAVLGRKPPSFWQHPG